MTQKSSAALIGGGVVAGVIVGGFAILVMGMGGFGKDLFGNTESMITLRVVNSDCVIGKETEVTVKKNKKITWRVRNLCAGPQTVTLGNFRTASNSSATNCDQAAQGPVWPFKDEDQGLAYRRVTVDPGKHDDITLRDAKNTGNTPLLYYFDTCVGSEKQDPRLVIDP